ncbi:Gfo/Idh/MocA family oxidoreductase [Microbacterium sp. X-17]|uniref:Gfo/Idh/MocA family protein n=1 Tax=Microbacterium sp. X-17 TaxID=3144404 RepID=UPI0031F56903
MTLSIPAPRVIPVDSVPQLRWGIVGTGIAASFVAALHGHTTQHATAVTARDVEKTRAFAVKHEIAVVHESIEALVEDPTVDVVYVATPHPLHHDVALAAIAAGKHVLVEKPIAMSAAEASEITEAGRAAGVLVMEAMWTRYLPQSDVIRQLLEDGAIGTVNIVDANFGFPAPFDPMSRMWSKELGGGALLDAGVYPISFASSILGSPTSVTAKGTVTETGVDGTASLLLTAQSGATALLTTSMLTSVPTTAVVMGTKGYIEIPSPFFGPTGVVLHRGALGRYEVTEWRDDSLPGFQDGLSHQATAFASYVGDGRLESPLHGHAETVAVMATIDEARRQIREMATR